MFSTEDKMKKLAKNISFFVFLFLYATSLLIAQDSFSIAEDTEVNIEGSSTLHAWKAVVGKVDGTLVPDSKFAKMKLKEGSALGTVSLKFEVATIDGGRGDTMNDKIKNALKNDTSPYIEFKAAEPATIVSIIDKSSNKFKAVSKGSLSMAGVTKPVEIELEGEFIDQETIKFTGAREMKMSDFDIEKPSAMFGTIVAGDDIKINFNLVFSNKTTKS